MFRRVRHALLALLPFLLIPLLVLAQPASERNLGPQALLDRWEAEAHDIQRQLELEDISHTDFNLLRDEAEEQAERIPPLIQSAEAAAQPIREQLEALGPPPEEGKTEAESVAAERERLNSELKDAEALIARLNQAKARAETLIGKIIETRRAIFTEKLLTRGPSPLAPSTIANGWAATHRETTLFINETAVQIEKRSFTAETIGSFVVSVVLFVGLLFGLRQLRLFAIARLSRMLARSNTQARRVTIGVILTLIRILVPTVAIVIALTGITATGLVGPQLLAFLYYVAVAMMMFIAVWALSLAYFAPSASAVRLSSLSDEAARRAHRWFMALAGVVALDRALVVSGQEMGRGIEGVAVFNAVFLVLGSVALWQTIRYVADRGGTGDATEDDGQSAEEEEEGDEATSQEIGLIGAVAAIASFAGRAIAIVAPLLAFAGYYAASRYLFYPFVLSGALVCFCMLLYQVAQASVERFISVTSSGSAGEGGSQGRMRLIPVFVGFLLTCVAVPLLALIWGASLDDIQLVWRRAAEGVSVGDLTIAPTDFVTFILVFIVGFAITRIIQSVLSSSVLPYTSLDTGGRDAIRTGIGYVGIIAAVLIAIATAGIDLSNLAIAVGALSVGIGFGLQNIVNNFVSGIILLIERPIKTGDWVELTSGMGYVRKINVRSTEIETFDRSSLIVPNSELISSSVTNWTHGNNNGRIIVPVRVAYGTDPRKIEKMLTEIANGHSMLLRRPAPFVLFQNFGPDALEFEIRGVLRDVNWVLNVASDIRYEVAERFAEEGIEIPFAQRDLYFRNADSLAEAFGRGLGQGPRAAEDEPEREKMPEGEQLPAADPTGAALAERGQQAEDADDPYEPPWETLEAAAEQENEDHRKPPSRSRAAGMDGGDGDGGAGGDGR